MENKKSQSHFGPAFAVKKCKVRLVAGRDPIRADAFSHGPCCSLLHRELNLMGIESY
jgi:hypothetical protein